MSDYKQVALEGATLINADCREVMASMPADSVDAIVCDPPYELTTGKKGGSGTASVALDSPYGRARIGAGNGAGGFMGKQWDASGVAHDPELWAEALRVLKPGGHLLAFGGTRTYHRLAVAIEDAGFEIRDCLSWMYGSGFPKSHDIGKKAEAWTGWGTALKPSWEPIIMARKPFKGTVTKNVLEHGTGALNIDATRISHASEADLATSLAKNPGRTDTVTSGVYGSNRPQQHVNTDGRWPANTLLSHDEDCVQVGERQVITGTAGPKSGGFGGGMFGDGTPDNIGGTHADPDGKETIPAWECVEGCPIAMLDAESGVVKGAVSNGKKAGTGFHGNFGQQEQVPAFGDKGGASRFFYCAKTPKKERNAGLPEGKVNNHPTVKPVNVMRWLVKMVTPPGGTVLDPFMGSGSTGIAALEEGFTFVGIDTESAYCNIAYHRLTHTIEQR